MSLSPVHLLRERGSYQKCKNLAPMPGHPLVTKTNGKNNGVQKTQTSWSLCSGGNKFECSGLPRTCSKSQSLPNSVIFITELHLHVFLALCSSSNSEPDRRLQRREVPDRLWITKITYLIVGTDKLQRILPRTLLFTDLNQFLIQLHLHFPAAVNT